MTSDTQVEYFYGHKSFMFFNVFFFFFDRCGHHEMLYGKLKKIYKYLTFYGHLILDFSVKLSIKSCFQLEIHVWRHFMPRSVIFQ